MDAAINLPQTLKVFCTIFVHGAPLDPDVAVAMNM